MIKPTITIGITTYNRLDYLRDTIKSLIQNKYEIEILIGNDYTEEKLDLEKIGVFDRRIRIINHPVNLGELENMNYLLSQASGEYFTWMFDDDPSSIYLMENIVKAIEENYNIQCIYTSYKRLVSEKSYLDNKKYIYNHKKYSGQEFLKKYFKGKVKVLGCLGFYKTSYLKKIGGAARLSAGRMALHAEYDLIIKSGLLNSLVYLDMPLVTTRVHSSSWSISNTDFALFSEAGINLIKSNINILISKELKNDFDSNFQKLLGFVIGSIVVSNFRSKNSLRTEYLDDVFDSIIKIKDEIEDEVIKKSILFSIKKVKKYIFLYKLKGRLKLILPLWLLKFLG